MRAGYASLEDPVQRLQTISLGSPPAVHSPAKLSLVADATGLPDKPQVRLLLLLHAGLCCSKASPAPGEIRPYTVMQKKRGMLSCNNLHEEGWNRQGCNPYSRPTLQACPCRTCTAKWKGILCIPALQACCQRAQRPGDIEWLHSYHAG